MTTTSPVPGGRLAQEADLGALLTSAVANLAATVVCFVLLRTWVFRATAQPVQGGTA
jgi:hypothetical protein